MLRTTPPSVDLLVLGAGWTSTFLVPLLKTSAITHALTTTSGRDGSIPFTFDPGSQDTAPYARLPRAKTVLVTFPLRGAGQAELLTSLYRQTHLPRSSSSSSSSNDGSDNGSKGPETQSQTQWIQLGSSGIFKGPHWNDSHAPYDSSNERAIAEDELRSCVGGCVLNLAGLYGGARQPRNWVQRVATSKAQVRAKQALHLVHGEDVARAVVALHRAFTPGKRWLVTDLHVYDWWDLMHAWGPEVEALAGEALGQDEARKLEYRRWVVELMEEEGVRALPRGPEVLGRVLDSREFWRAVGAWPSKGRVV